MKNNYIIKGLWDNQEVYYVGIDKKHTFFGLPVVRLSTTIKEAKLFGSTESVEKEYQEVSHATFKIYPICPLCHKEYSQYPAISRKDNKTKICPDCGIREALHDFIEYKKRLPIR